jgi:hypothetical protein
MWWRMKSATMQNLMGISAKMDQMRSRVSKTGIQRAERAAGTAGRLRLGCGANKAQYPPDWKTAMWKRP